MWMRWERASVTVLAQALASFFRSNFFLMFLIGVLGGLPFPFPNRRVELLEESEIPGYSPTFQCLFFCSADFLEEEDLVVDGEEEAQRMRVEVEAAKLMVLWRWL